MYLLSFLIGWRMDVARTRQPHVYWHKEEVGDFLFYVVLGVVSGGRIGYVLLNQPELYFHHPLQFFAVWDGGISFHGGRLGVLLVSAWFAHKTQRTFFQITDFVALMVPIGLFFGRIGNFIHGELYGRVTDVPWAMIYPKLGIAIITTGLVTLQWRSSWPDLIVGLGSPS